MLSRILATIDPSQLAVAGAATAGYALTSIILHRAYIKRRRQRTRRHARFSARLIDGARRGTVTTLSDATALFRACCLSSSRDELAQQRLEFLIRRAFFRELRQAMRRHRRTGVSDNTARETTEVLRRLLYHSQAATLEELVQRAGVSEADRDVIRLEAGRSADRDTGTLHSGPHLRVRRAGQRRTASWVRNGLVGAGCIAFVEVVLVVWQSLR